jgi:hypothetical protein
VELVSDDVDPDLDAGVLRLASAGFPKAVPGRRYYDGNNGDLKYAKLSPPAGGACRRWTSVGEVGLYPSLTFSRPRRPIISYYSRTNGDLRMATTCPADG